MWTSPIALAALCAAAAAVVGASGAIRTVEPQGPGAREDLQAVLSAIPNLKRGERLFATCAVCHGTQGEGSAKGWAPAIAGQYPRVIAKELVDYRHGIRWDLRMERIAGRHVLESAQDIADVTAYVGHLMPRRATSFGSGEWIGRGKRLYAALCRSCHGPHGEGSNARFIPRLAGQRYAYLLRQLHDSVDGRRPNMAATHHRALRELDVEELTGLADYLSRLAWSGARPVSHRAVPAAAGPAGGALVTGDREPRPQARTIDR